MADDSDLLLGHHILYYISNIWLPIQLCPTLIPWIVQTRDREAGLFHMAAKKQEKTYSL